MATVKSSQLVTAGHALAREGSQGGSQHGLLQNSSQRPKVNALQPHIIREDRRMSRGSNNNSIGNGAGQNIVALSMDSKTIAANKSGMGNSSQLQAAGRSTISAGKIAGSKQTTKNGFFSHSNMAGNTNLGRLPTLGLNQIKLEEFQDEDNNLFKIQPNTEKQLVARELEREFKDLNKFEKDNLRIWEKGISTRIDRAGTIRCVNAIPALKPDNDKKKGQGSRESEEAANANKQKLNIFDAQDSQVLKAETLARLGHDEKALVPADSESQLSSALSSAQSDAGKPKSIEYLNKGRQQKETVRDFIENSRKILMAQISINHKTEETELLKEYIVMEKDKLEESKKTFLEDKEKYEKFKGVKDSVFYEHNLDSNPTVKHAVMMHRKKNRDDENDIYPSQVKQESQAKASSAFGNTGVNISITKKGASGKAATAAAASMK